MSKTFDLAADGLHTIGSPAKTSAVRVLKEGAGNLAAGLRTQVNALRTGTEAAEPHSAAESGGFARAGQRLQHSSSSKLVLGDGPGPKVRFGGSNAVSALKSMTDKGRGRENAGAVDASKHHSRHEGKREG